MGRWLQYRFEQEPYRVFVWALTAFLLAFVVAIISAMT